MNYKAMILAVTLAAAFSALPAAMATEVTLPTGLLSATPCNPTQSVHTYAIAGVAGANANTQTLASGGVEDSFDGCQTDTVLGVGACVNTTCVGQPCGLGVNVDPADPLGFVISLGCGGNGDGDFETGLGGGAFAAGVSCTVTGETPHHAFADG